MDAELINRAGEDLRMLLDRGYRKDYALRFVGDHYELPKKQRNLIMRAVYSEAEVRQTREKLRPVAAMQGHPLAIDGFNVIITVETGLEGGEIFMSQDGILRDNTMAFGSYRVGSSTREAADKVLEVLNEHPPSQVTWVFDSQISRSGRLAAYVGEKMDELGLDGAAMTCPTADHRLVKMNVLTATSDSALIERLTAIVDLPGEIIDF